MVAANETKKPVGRPPAVREEVSTETTEDVAVRTEGQREVEKTPRARVPFGAPRTKLGVTVKPEGYHLHWVNDTAGRIHAAQEGYYEFCTPAEVGRQPTDDGKVKELVGKNAQGGPLWAYLMKVKQEYYDDDQEIINERQDAFEQALKTRGNNQNGEYGYVPKEGIKLS